MVIDTSAVIAILYDEHDRAAYTRAIAHAPVRAMSAANLLECSIVIESRFGPAGGRELDLLVHRADVHVATVDASQVELARRAWRRFGRGHHPAALNFGDCFAYALAADRGEPLLFKGADFARTDLVPAI